MVATVAALAPEIAPKIAEVPITLHPDGRKAHAPHLKTFRDGWRTLRFFLICSPRWLFVYPGSALLALGALGYAVAMPGLTLFGATFDAHTLLCASLAWLMGYQAVLFGWLARTLNQTSAFGAFLDPVADKLIVATALVLLMNGALAFFYGGLVRSRHMLNPPPPRLRSLQTMPRRNSSSST